MEIETIETVEPIAPVVEPVIEIAADETPIPEPSDALEAAIITEGEEAKETVTEDVTEGEAAPVEATPEAAPEPVVFAPELETTELLEKGKAIVENYIVDQPLQAYIEALEAKAQVTPLAEYAVYGDTEAVRGLLERQSLLDSVKELPEGGYRYRTDEFVQSIAHDQNKVDWLKSDLLKLPSAKYPGVDTFYEVLVDRLALPGDSVQDVLDRYEDTITAMRTGATIVPDIPAFIPPTLQEAYAKLSKDTREWLTGLDAETYQDEIAAQVAQLELMQRGLNADKADAQREIQARQQHQATRDQKVSQTQETFWNKFQEDFKEQYVVAVKYSDDPNIQAMEVEKDLAFLARILDTDTSGERARQSLSKAGVKFDAAVATQFYKEVEKASVALAGVPLNAQGEPLDQTAYRKATKEFETVTKKLLDFSNGILQQKANLVKTGKAEEIKEAVAKRPVELKARPVPKGVATAAVKKTELPPMGTQAWKEHWANARMEELAQTANAYRP